MSNGYRFKAVIIASALLGAVLFLNGCIGMTSIKKTESDGLLMEALGKDFPLSFSHYPEPAASKIGQHIKSTETPEEWAAIQCLGGVTLDSVTLVNSRRNCEDCSGASAVPFTETFRSALAHALGGTPSPPQSCRAIKSLKLHVTFLHRIPFRSDSFGSVALATLSGMAFGLSLSLLAPGTTDTIVKINAVAQPVQGVEVHAEGIGAATDVTTNIIRYSPPYRAVFIALAEALKAVATDLKKQADEQCKANEALPLTDSLRFRCGEAP